MTDWINDGHETWPNELNEPKSPDKAEWATEEEMRARFIDETVPVPEPEPEFTIGVNVVFLPAEFVEWLDSMANEAWYEHVLQCPHHTQAEKVHAMEELGYGSSN